LRIGDSVGFNWEVEQAFIHLNHRQILFCFPEGSIGFQHLKENYQQYIQKPLPKNSKNALFLWFDDNNNPILLSPNNNSEIKWYSSPSTILTKMLEPIFEWNKNIIDT